jgi:hypothetical protein
MALTWHPSGNDTTRLRPSGTGSFVMYLACQGNATLPANAVTVSVKPAGGRSLVVHRSNDVIHRTVREREAVQNRSGLC